MKDLLPHHGVKNRSGSVLDRKSELLNASQTFPFGDKDRRMQASVDWTHQPGNAELPVIVGQETDVLDGAVVIVELDFLVGDQIPDDQAAAWWAKGYQPRKRWESWTGGHKNSCHLLKSGLPPMISWTSKQLELAMLISFNRPMLNLSSEVIIL